MIKKNRREGETEMRDEEQERPVDPRDKRCAREEELDRFWNIDALIPSRRPAPVSRNTETTEIEVNPPERAGNGETTVVHPAENGKGRISA